METRVARQSRHAYRQFVWLVRRAGVFGSCGLLEVVRLRNGVEAAGRRSGLFAAIQAQIGLPNYRLPVGGITAHGLRERVGGIPLRLEAAGTQCGAYFP